MMLLPSVAAWVAWSNVSTVLHNPVPSDPDLTCRVACPHFLRRDKYSSVDFSAEAGEPLPSSHRCGEWPKVAQGRLITWSSRPVRVISRRWML